MLAIKDDRESVEQFISKLPIFKHISDDSKKLIADDLSIVQAKKDKIVIFQAEESTDFYIILKGKVKVTLMNEKGEEFVLTELHDSDFFGEMSLLDGRPRSASVIAEEDSTLGVLKQERLYEAIKQNPMIAIDLLRSLVDRLRKANERAERFAFLDMRERLLRQFRELIRTEGKKEKDGSYRITKRTHKELATRIGGSREAVSKVMKVLVSKNIIKEKDRYFFISPSAYKEIEEL